MQLFILLFIEGGSYIQEDEDTWEFVVLWVPFIQYALKTSGDLTSIDQVREADAVRLD
jgi:hypothetical protein